MNFGDLVKPAESVDAGLWIAPACSGERGTVGNMVPGTFDAVVRVLPPEPEADDAPDDYNWWLDYREVFTSAVAVGENHTDTADHAWFATWEGYGFDNYSKLYAKASPLSWRDRREVKKVRKELREKERQEKIAIRKELAKYPLLEHRIRAYYLMEGPLSAVAELKYPGPEAFRDDWGKPDLILPDDRNWIIVTDVDFWSLYVAGSASFISELTQRMTGQVEAATWSDHLPLED